MKNKAIIATGLVTLALLAGCNKAEEPAATKTQESTSTTTTVTPAAPAEAPAVTRTQESTSTTTTPAPATEGNNIRFAGSQFPDWGLYIACSGSLQWSARAYKASTPSQGRQGLCIWIRIFYQ